MKSKHRKEPVRTLIIAEIGINHNGDMDIAKQLIDMAKQCGCDVVKFQKRTVDLVYTREFLETQRKSPWGSTQRQQKEGLEFGDMEYDEIDAYCSKIQIDWFASAWDLPSQIFLRKYGLKYNKIASAMLSHPELPEVIAKEGKLTFISTGMSTFDEIGAVVKRFESHKCPFILMHSVSSYPCREEDLNLSLIPELKRRFGCRVGYSGHEASVSPSVVATVLGAEVIERHITLDRAMYGSDQPASLERQGLATLVGQIRKVPMVLGDGVKRIIPQEVENAKKLRYWVAD